MKRRRIALRLSWGLLFLTAVSWSGADAAARGGADAITAREMRVHVDFLASDLLEGRDAGQRGADLAAKYIAAQFERLGLDRVGDKWEMEFDLPGGGGEGTAEVRLGDRRFLGASVVSVPRCSATAQLTARVATGDAERFDGELVLVDSPSRRDERRVAQDLLAKGAGGVIFVADQPWLDTAAYSHVPWGNDERPVQALQAGGEKGAGQGEDFGDLPPEIQDQIENMLAGMGVDPSQGQVKIVVGGDPTEAGQAGGEKGGDAALPLGNLPKGATAEVVMSGGGGFWGSAPRLAGPVVRVCQSLGQRLREAADSDEKLTVRVTRPGRDKSCNVLALVKGTDPQLKDEYVVVGAHYDHIGINARGQVCNGADDNASGTAALLGVAEALAATTDKPKRSILLVAWSAEEHGLVGSGAFGRNPPVPLEKIVGYVNLDMVGRNDPHEIEIGSASETLGAWAREAARAHEFTPKDIGGAFLGASDTAVFLEQQIPTVFFHSGMQRQLHSPGDKAELVDADKVARVARATSDVVWRAADETQRPVFTAPKTKAFDFGGFKFGVPGGGRRLGIYPGPAEGEGVPVQDIVPGSVAAKAGIKAGDRIVRIGERRIEKGTEIRAALEALPAGEPFEIEVRRTGDQDKGEQTLILKGVFEDKDKDKAKEKEDGKDKELDKDKEKDNDREKNNDKEKD